MAGPGIRSDVARVNKRLAKFSDEISGKPMQNHLRGLGGKMQLDAATAVRRTMSRTPGHTLADGSMSGWWRGRPIQLATRITPRDLHQGYSLMVTPDKTAGLWRILEVGRATRKKGDLVKRGVTRKGAVRKRRVRRNQGGYEGAGVWSEAVLSMTRRAQRDVPQHAVKVFRKTFGG